jgi:multidrug resistance efflux pump
VSAKLALARTRVERYRGLVKTGAGNASISSAPWPTCRSSKANSPRAAKCRRARPRAGARRERQIQQKLGATSKGEYAQVAQNRAQLENAKWQLDQATTRSPCDCYVINLQLRPGGFVAGFPLNPVMTLVEADGQVLALYHQNELHQVKPGNEVEFALKTMPGKIIKTGGLGGLGHGQASSHRAARCPCPGRRNAPAATR